MNTVVKILIRGYARYENGVLAASPSAVLINDSGLNVLIDPSANEKLLIDSLSRESISLKDIDIIFVTHYHLDHVLNIRLFPEKDIISGEGIFRNDRMLGVDNVIPGTTLKIIQTPGHSPEHCSVLANTVDGVIAVAGDVFWWMDDEDQKTDSKSLLEKSDEFANDFTQLVESRKKLLEISDYIIPGHGKMFKV